MLSSGKQSELSAQKQRLNNLSKGGLYGFARFILRKMLAFFLMSR